MNQPTDFDHPNWNLWKQVYSSATPDEKKQLDDLFIHEDYAKIKLPANMAGLLLKLNFSNRPMHRTNIEGYKTDMRTNRFYIGAGDSILFDCWRRGRNGQHRLTAQDEVGLPMPYMFRFNVPEEELAVIDKGLARNFQDSLNLIPGFPEEFGRKVDNEGTIVNFILTEGTSSPQNKVGVTVFSQKDLLMFFKPSLDFVKSIIGPKKITKITTNSAFLATFVQAHKFGEDENKLVYALKYMMDDGLGVETGEMSSMPANITLKTLRNWIVSHPSTARKVYWTSQKMVKCFIDGVERKSISSDSIQKWPLDDVLAAILPKEPQIVQQSNILGKEVMKSIGVGFKNQKYGTEIKKKTILDMVGLANRSVLSNKIKKIITKFGGLELPDNLGELIPVGGIKRQTKFIYRKK